jgi:hypothetical protein
MRRPRQLDCTAPGFIRDHRQRKRARQSVDYGGEIATAAISQNFFVGRPATTAFSKQTPGEKECTLALR